MKKKNSIFLASLLLGALVVGCSTAPAPFASSALSSEGTSAVSSSQPSQSSPSFDSSKGITVISREDGSGTRGAFIELFGIEEKDAQGNKTDRTTLEAVVTNKTDVMLATVAGNPYAVGYVSLGSLNGSVKALSVDGAAATTDNVKNGSYKVSRPFNIATKGEPAGLTKDFIDFILSKEGQEVVSASYIPVNDASPAFAGEKPAGKIVAAGSSSVTPIMEKLAEAYQKVNPGAQIEIQMTDSTAGMTSAMDGVCDIGMASRELKESESSALTGVQIAIDGIAVIVNNENPLADIASEQVKSIYIGETTAWNQLQG